MNILNHKMTIPFLQNLPLVPSFKVEVVYEKYPSFCNNCKTIGHSNQQCQKLGHNTVIATKDLKSNVQNVISTNKNAQPGKMQMKMFFRLFT